MSTFKPLNQNNALKTKKGHHFQ